MSETITPPVESPVTAIPAAPEPAPVASPVAPEPVSAPTSTPSAAPEPAAPVATPEAPVEQVPAVESELKPHTEAVETLLEGFEVKKPEETPKPADAKPEAKPAEAASEAPTTEPIVYEAFKLPDGVTAEPARLAAYTDVLGKHRIPQEAGQALLDMHAETVQQLQVNQLAEQHRVFGEMRRQWQESIKSDPQLGGAGHETTKAAVARMRDLLVKEEHRAEFNDFIKTTGAGDHPALWRLLHNAARFFDEPAIQTFVPSPTANSGAPRGRNGFRQSMYTHPSSQGGH